MWCMMHVKDGEEERTEQFLERFLDRELCNGCFHLTRLRRKKYGGRWQTVQESFLPGYVFIATGEPEKLYQELKKTQKFENRTVVSDKRRYMLSGNGGEFGLLGSDEAYVATLESREADFIERIAGKGDRAGEIGLSVIGTKEDGGVTVLSGPLLFVEDKVRKIDFHKRVAEVETNLLGKTKRMYLGVEFEDRM